MRAVAQPLESGALVRAPMPSADGALLVAIVLSGGAAGTVVGSMLWLTTAVVVALLALVSFARRPLMAQAAELLPEFPPALRALAIRTLDALDSSEAVTALDGVMQPARSLLASQESAFDATADRQLQASIVELVTGACALALELSRLDQAAPSPSADATVIEQHHAAKTLVRTRLGRAAMALSSVYAAGVAHGTPASDRVVELAAELGREAELRGAAKAEVDAVVRLG